MNPCDGMEESRDGATESSLPQDTGAPSSSRGDILPVNYQIVGYISQVGEGVGRSDNDRQFVFVNSRPVDLGRVTKVLNECWKRFEMKQKPAFIVNIIIPPGHLDVNLSPDKREVVILHEMALLQRLRGYIDELYAPSRSTFKVGMGISNRSTIPLMINDDNHKNNIVSPVVNNHAATSSIKLIDASSGETKEMLPSQHESRTMMDSEVLVDYSPDTENTVIGITGSDESSPVKEKIESTWSFNFSDALEKFKRNYSKTLREDDATTLYVSPAKLIRADESIKLPVESPSKVLSRVLSKSVIQTNMIIVLLVYARYRTSSAWK